MSDVEPPEEDTTPVAHATIAYLGPVAPHWEIRGHFGDTKLLDDFWARVTARLLLLPRHDPQFRRNKERVNRDAERERIILDWDLGDEESVRSSGAPARRAKKAPAVVQAAPEPAPAVVEAPGVEDAAPAEEPAVVEAAPEAAAEETPAPEESATESESPSDTPEA